MLMLAELVFEEVYKHHGLPKNIISDQDVLFMSTFWGHLLEYPEAVRACAMRRYPRNLGTFLILIVFLHSSGCRPILYFSLFIL